MAAPMWPRSIVLGEALCSYLTLALVRSALIVTVDALLFGVHRWAPLPAAALLTAAALVTVAPLRLRRRLVG